MTKTYPLNKQTKEKETCDYCHGKKPDILVKNGDKMGLFHNGCYQQIIGFEYEDTKDLSTDMLFDKYD